MGMADGVVHRLIGRQYDSVGKFPANSARHANRFDKRSRNRQQMQVAR
jgi:hypothetical protein